jgi:hypothetical protein
MTRRARGRRKASRQDFMVLSIGMALRRALHMVYQTAHRAAYGKALLAQWNL